MLPPIGKLTRKIIEEKEDGTQISRLPDNEEVMNKINEIITYINKLQAKEEPNPFAPRREL